MYLKYPPDPPSALGFVARPAAVELTVPRPLGRPIADVVEAMEAALCRSSSLDGVLIEAVVGPFGTW